MNVPPPHPGQETARLEQTYYLGIKSWGPLLLLPTSNHGSGVAAEAMLGVHRLRMSARHLSKGSYMVP